jgi:hypothetical protein
MRAGEDPEPDAEGGDPACWAHLVEDDELRADGDDDAEDPREGHD